MTTQNTGSPPPPKRRGRRLRRVEDVRRFVADVLRRIDDPVAPLDPRRARALLYGASILAQLVAGADFEARVAALEKAIREQREDQGQGRRLAS